MTHARPSSPRPRAAWSLLTLTTLIVYVQIVLGALVRHTGSSEAGGWGLAGAIIPQQAGTGRFIFWPAGAPWPVVLVIAQICAGVLMLALWNVQIYSGLHVSGPAATTIQILARTAHLALGALLLISLFYPTLLLGEAARQE